MSPGQTFTYRFTLGYGVPTQWWSSQEDEGGEPETPILVPHNLFTQELYLPYITLFISLRRYNYTPGMERMDYMAGWMAD